MSNTEENNDRSNKKAFKNLLDQLQMESWQLELIISGVALFAVWELKAVVGYLREFSSIFGQSSRTATVIIPFLGISMSLAWIVLFINLIVHIFSRGLWIGMIGLRYVSQDIDYDSLNYAPKFDSFLRKKVGSFDDYIEGLERFSSILFAYTFFLIFLMISFLSFFGAWSLLAYLFLNVIENEIVTAVFFIGLLIGSLLVFLDFIFLSPIKKVTDKNISNIYFWVYRFFSFITLSFLYRPLIYNFLDDKFAKKFFLFSIPYFLIIFVFSGIIFNPTLHFPFRSNNYLHDSEETESESFSPLRYDEERDHIHQNFFGSKYSIKIASIPSKVITKNYGQVFLRMYHRDENYFEKKKGISPYDKKGFIHSIRGDRNKEKDKIQSTLKAEQDSILRLHILKKVDLIKKLRKNLITQNVTGTKILNENIVLDTTYWKHQRDSIENVWEAKIQKAKVKKVYNIKDAFLELNEIAIDDIPYNDSLSCKFYIHPNLGERGMLCFFPIKNLNDGEHQLKVRRRLFNTQTRFNKETITVDTVDRVIPFYIYKEK